MAGVTPFDVANLNQSMAGLGNVFAQRRAEDLARQRLAIESDVRQKMLDAEMRRLEVEQGRQNLLEQGSVDTWLQGDDGGTFHFQGPQAGLRQLMDHAEQNGKPMTVLDQPPGRPAKIGTFKTQTPLGNFEIDVNSLDDLDKLREIGQHLGGKSPAGEPGQAAAIQTDRAAAELESQRDAENQQADDLEAQLSSGPGQWDPTAQDQANKHRANASYLGARASVLRQNIGHPDPTQFQTVTTRPNPWGAGPPVVSTTRRVPTGTVAAPDISSALGAAPPPPPADPAQRVTGTRYTTPKGVFGWTGSGWSR